MTQTWVMKHNCSNSGPCSNLTDHCSREWPNSGKILVSIFCIFDMSPVSDWMIWLVMCRFPGRRSQDWLPWNGNSRTAKPDVSFNVMIHHQHNHHLIVIIIISSSSSHHHHHHLIIIIINISFQIFCQAVWDSSQAHPLSLSPSKIRVRTFFFRDLDQMGWWRWRWYHDFYISDTFNKYSWEIVLTLEMNKEWKISSLRLPLSTN